MGDLARRLVACPEWRWQEGMRNVLGWRRMDEPAGDWLDDMGEWQNDPPPRDGTGLESPPDLTDAATAGCLLSWLPGPCSAARSSDGQHSVWVAGHLPTGWHPTLGEAAASALIALWEVRRG